MSENQQLIAGRYERGDLIGRGGMGDVFVGVDTATSEPVAIKLLHESIVQDNPDIVDRFRREGEALRQLDHPNIVKLLDAFEEDGKHYLVMEYVSGGSLRDLMDEEIRLPLEAVLNIALDLADALTRAHRLNIIHRDIKPDNVLLAEDATPRLTDFGVAHLGDRTRLTQTGSVIGTYAYLSPEACNGLELDERTDIWSFGVMLFEMLAGRVPFQESSTGAILTAILTKPAPDLNRLRPGLPPALIDLVSRMLEKDRDRRIPRIRLVGAELEAIIRGMDTPLRDMVLGPSARTPGSRFATPSEGGGSEVPAMMRAEDEQLTHGFSVYPTGQAPPPGQPPGPGPMMTPGGSPITETFGPSGTNFKWLAMLIMVIVTACAGVLAVAIITGDYGADDEADAPAAEVGAPAPDRLTVEPVAPDEFMVLVAELEPLRGADERDVSRFIADDLEQEIEVNVPFSKARVRSYPAVITTEDEAQAVAAANDATVIIWGRYGADFIELEVAIGQIDAFPNITLDPAQVEQTANVRVRLDDERAASVAPQVMAVLAILQAADGDIYEYMRSVAVAAEVDAPPAQPVGDSVAAHVHEHYIALNNDNQAALDHINQAIDTDSTNPLLFVMRGGILARGGEFAPAARDAETAGRLYNSMTGETWALPFYLMGNNDPPEEQLAMLSRIVELRPDDWFALANRGTFYYFIGERDKARADLEAAIALEPPSNYPYAMAALLAMSDGRYEATTAYITVILTEFPDPDLYQRIISATVGEYDTSGPLVSAFVNMSLGRYDRVIESLETARARGVDTPDIYGMQGVAYCNLGEYEQAADSLDRALESYDVVVSSFLRLIRGDVRRKLGNETGAQADFATAADILGADHPLVTGFISGAVDCTNYFGTAAEVENPAIPGEADAPGGPVEPEGAADDDADADAIPLVEPVAPDEVMVLVAEFEDFSSGLRETASGRRRDVTRFVADNLERTLVDELPNSVFRVRHYPREITSDDEARAVAEANGATVIVWGNYNDEVIELQVQVGVLDRLPYNHFSREIIERTANVRVILTDERRQCVAQQVLNIVNILTVADGDEIGFFLTAAALDGVSTGGTDVPGNSVAAHTHRALATYTTSTQATLREFDAALDLDSGNPLLYLYRGLTYLRELNFDRLATDLETARRLGPDEWTGPLYLEQIFAETVEEQRALQDQIIALRPDDWYPYYQRGLLAYYESNDLDAAAADLARSIERNPTTQYPYLLSIFVALRQGEIEQAQAHADLIIRQFPDPDISNRAMQALYDLEFEEVTAVLVEAGTNLLLGQYLDVTEQLAPIIEEGLASSGLQLHEEPVGPVAFDSESWDAGDLLLLQGLAQCNLGEHEEALANYDWAFRLQEGYPVLHLLRAQARVWTADPDGAAEDFAAAAESAQGESLAAWIAAAQDWQWTCQNFFEYQPSP